MSWKANGYTIINESGRIVAAAMPGDDSPRDVVATIVHAVNEMKARAAPDPEPEGTVPVFTANSLREIIEWMGKTDARLCELQSLAVEGIEECAKAMRVLEQMVTNLETKMREHTHPFACGDLATRTYDRTGKADAP